MTAQAAGEHEKQTHANRLVGFLGSAGGMRNGMLVNRGSRQAKRRSACAAGNGHANVEKPMRNKGRHQDACGP